jgi:hypothetical protein
MKRYVVQLETIYGDRVVALEGNGPRISGRVEGHSTVAAASKEAVKRRPARVWDRKLRRPVTWANGRTRIRRE